MNIKTRLAVQFTIIVAGILLFFSLLVYYFSYSSQLKKFHENLFDSAKNTAILLLKVAEVDSSLLKKIHQSTIQWQKEEICLLDSSMKIIYSNNVQYLNPAVTKMYCSVWGARYFTVNEKDGVCYRYDVNHKRYYVYVMAYDKSRQDNLKELKEILFWSILFSIWLSVISSYFFSRRAIKPISTIVQQVKDINSMKLSTRLDEGRKRDEIDRLAVTFNELLSELEIAFRNQAEFISNASHELRTPLSIIISESNYILNHESEKEEYIKHISSTVADLKEINALFNSLLELAQINRDNNISITRLRIDELIFTAVHQVKLKYPSRKIIPKIEYPENENELYIQGNEGLLTIAFKNLLDNACKFSADDVIINLNVSSENIVIGIADNGIGIPESELTSVIKPFSRASNARYIGGFGIGLSLVLKILEIHNASFDIKSSEGQGTTIRITFPGNG